MTKPRVRTMHEGPRVIPLPKRILRTLDGQADGFAFLPGVDRSGRQILVETPAPVSASAGYAFEQAVRAGVPNLRGVRIDGQDIVDLDMSAADVVGANFRRSNFITVKAIGMKLSDCDFARATIQASRFDGSTFAGAIFGDARIERSSFVRADFKGAQLDYVQVAKSDFTEALFQGVMRQAYFDGCAFVDADFADCALTDSAFKYCNLDGANLSGCRLDKVSLQACSLRGADLEGAQLWHADLSGTPGDDADFTDLERADLQNATMQDANLTAANLEGASLVGADLRGVNFRFANLMNANLEGARFDERTQFHRADLTGARLDENGEKYVAVAGAMANPLSALAGLGWVGGIAAGAAALVGGVYLARRS